MAFRFDHHSCPFKRFAFGYLWMEGLPGEEKLGLLGWAASNTSKLLGAKYAERMVSIFLQVPENFSGHKYLAELFSAWAKSAPTAAATRALQLASEPQKAGAVEGVAQAWAETDPKAALAWLATLEDLVLAQKAQGGLIRGLAERDPLTALEHLGSLPLTIENKSLIGQVLEMWVRKDASAALHWADNLRDEDARQTAFEKVLTQASVKDPEKAMEILLARAERIKPSAAYYEYLVSGALRRHGPDKIDAFFSQLPETHRNAAGRFLIRKLEEQPEALEKWALKQQDESLRETAFERVALHRYTKDDKAAVTWAASLPKGASRDAAVLEIANAYSGLHPDRAVQLGELMSETEGSEDLLRLYFTEWRRRDAAKADAWLRGSKFISDAFKRDLLTTE